MCFIETENEGSVVTQGGAKIWVTVRCRDAERTVGLPLQHSIAQH